MKTLTSREGKQPPATYYAMILAYLAEAYPDSKLSTEDVQALKPIWDDLWRAGRSAEATAQTTCSCDGKRVVPSPALGVTVPKGAARAPAKAARGSVPKLSELREPAAIEVLKRKAAKEMEKVELLNQEIAAFLASLKTTPPRTEASAETKRARIEQLQRRLGETIDSVEASVLAVKAKRAELAVEGLAFVQRQPELKAPPRPEGSDFQIEAVPKEKAKKGRKEKDAAAEPAKATAASEKLAAKPESAKGAPKRGKATSTAAKDQAMTEAVESALTKIIGNLKLGQ